MQERGSERGRVGVREGVREGARERGREGGSEERSERVSCCLRKQQENRRKLPSPHGTKASQSEREHANWVGF